MTYNCSASARTYQESMSFMNENGATAPPEFSVRWGRTLCNFQHRQQGNEIMTIDVGVSPMDTKYLVVQTETRSYNEALINSKKAGTSLRVTQAGVVRSRTAVVNSLVLHLLLCADSLTHLLSGSG